MTISICTIVYNHEKFLDSYYEGIVSQLDEFGTVLDHKLELNIVIDNSPDKSIEKLSSYNWKNIDFNILFHTENKGGPYSYTECLKMASGEYIAMLEGDDYYKPEKLAKSLQYLIDNNLDVMHTEISAWVGDGTTWVENGWKNIGIYQPQITSFDYLMQGNRIYTCTLLGKREAMNSTPTPLEFSNKFGFLGDFPKMLYIAKQGYKIGYLDSALSVYRDNIGVNTDREKSQLYYNRVMEWAANGCKLEDL